LSAPDQRRDERFDGHDHVHELEGLRDVAIGACGEALADLVGVRFRAENKDDGGLVPGGLEFPADLDSVAIGQTAVEQDGVRGALFQVRARLDEVRGRLHGYFFVLQDITQEFCGVFLVLNYQDRAHALSVEPRAPFVVSGWIKFDENAVKNG
jgi:hypothetical protein